MKQPTRRTDAFSLVEVTLALGVATISLLAIFTLLPVGVQTNQRAFEQTAAVDILSAVAADLRATPVTSPQGSATPSPQFHFTIPGNPVATPVTTEVFFSGEGQCSNTLDGSTQPDGSSWVPALQLRYRLTISFLPNDPGTTPARTATFVDLKMTWPAAATVPNAQGSAEMFVALDRN